MAEVVRSGAPTPNKGALVQPSSPHFSIRNEVRAPGQIAQHTHPYFEVLLLVAGRRIQHFALRDIEAGPGHLLFMPPNVPHGATLQTENVSLFFQFNLAFLRPELSDLAQSAWSEPAALDAVPELLPFVAQPHLNFHCDAKLAQQIRVMGKVVRDRQESQALGALHYARALMSLTLLDVVRRFERRLREVVSTQAPPVASPSRLEDLFAFLRNQLSESVTVNDAARHLHVSPSCLSARIKRVTGKTFGELVLEQRLVRAKELLLYSDQRVSEIAYACGFNDHSYFSRRFRQIIGVAPVDYRRHIQAGGAPGPAEHDMPSRVTTPNVISMPTAQRSK